ncbi:hypothetical protein [Mesorhizobium sp. M0847]|uniref:hypothetical protein n=1 Tax=unclassified Mesorhizobium TaxID=325217 RepID=UPI003337F5C7
MSWWAANSADGRNLPLSVFVSANDVRDDNAEELLAKVLARRLGHGDATFWLRRVGLWQRADFAGQQFILVVDGLNQNWRKRDWSDFLQPLYDERWKGRFAVLTAAGQTIGPICTGWRRWLPVRMKFVLVPSATTS